MTMESKRPVRVDKQSQLFETEPDWTEHWWGMPEFEMNDCRPQYRITMNFMTAADVQDFAKLTGTKLTTKSDSCWYPVQERLSGNFEYDGPKVDSRYPICLPSKGRADHQTTGTILDQMGVSYKFFVEQQEYDIYCERLGEDKVVSMPFSNLGQGSIPARNYIWEYCKERGAKRHWTVDDNIKRFSRCHNNRRLAVRSGGMFRAMEDFVDRYENIVMAGPHNQGFVPDRDPNMTPYLMNSRIYSCILLDTNLQHRWRGRYNEDTDLSLRLLKEGHATCLFRSLLMDKAPTNYGNGKNTGATPGGNTDNVYQTDDHRRAFADSLKEQHPDVVEVVWKFNRWHHKVDYSPFAKNDPMVRGDITPIEESDNYGMEIVEIKKKGE